MSKSKKPSTVLQILKKRKQHRKALERQRKLESELREIEDRFPNCSNVLSRIDEPEFAGTYVVNAEYSYSHRRRIVLLDKVTEQL